MRWRDLRRTYRQLRRLAGARRDREELRDLLHMAENFRVMELNLKAFGYDLARRMAEALPVPAETAARYVGLASKCSTQADIESDWVAHWARSLRVPVVYHRKLWELAFVLQAIYEHGHLVPGTRGLGFGSGREPIPSLLAAAGVAVTATDLAPDDGRAGGWAQSAQHAASLDAVYHPHLVDRALFDQQVRFESVDMNAIPPALSGYDFCWSTCALEHLGSIERGLRFVVRSLATVRPGGTAVHTTEYNPDGEGPTIEHGETVLFQRRHFEALAAELSEAGHAVASFDFDTGSGPMDHFVDLPPWQHDGTDPLVVRMRDQRHLKIAMRGHVATCFGIVVRKAG